MKSFNLLKAVSGSAGVTRSFNGTRQLAAYITFPDGSASIVTIDVP